MIQIDMPMPTSCAACPCADDTVRFCRAAKEYIPMLGRPRFCPLREVDIVFDKSKAFAFAMDDMTDEEYFNYLKNRSIMMRKGATDEPATEDR